jgi:hypothetical protein
MKHCRLQGKEFQEKNSNKKAGSRTMHQRSTQLNKTIKTKFSIVDI